MSQHNIKCDKKWLKTCLLHIAHFTVLTDNPRFITFRRLKLSHITEKEAGQDACPARNATGTLHAVDE